VLVNVRVAEKKPLEGLPEIQDAIRKVEGALAGGGRVLIRYSGTEPKARVMVEGEDEARVQEYAQDLARTLQRVLGAA
jgi:phosphoglucosamine mutase